MQISNMLGKYDQNSVPVAAQEQTAKTGTQQLTNSLSSLSAGHIFEGTVREFSGNQVMLMLGNGESIAARIEGQVDLAMNQSMFFEVKSNTGTQIAIKPYLNGLSSNPTLMKALMQAGLGVTEDHLDMVKSMMEEQLPIDKNSLNQMVRQMAAFPKAEPSVLAQMNKLGIPVNEANIQQFMNYKADTSAIMGELNGIIDQIPESLVQEGSTPAQMVDKNGRMIEILLGKGEAQAATGETIQSTADGTVTAKVINPELAEGAENHKDAAGNPAQMKMGEEAAGGEAKITGEVPGKEISQSPEGSLGRLLGKGEAAALEKQLQNLGLEKNGGLLDAEGRLNTRLTSEEFLQKLQGQLKENVLPDRDALENLFSGKEYKALLKDAIGRQWFLEPQQVESKENISKLYDKLQDQMNRLENFAKQSGLENTGLQKAVSTVRGNIEFMNQINQIYNFVQIPLKMSGQNVNSELFVYTNKKNPRDPNGELSAFLHLDMDHLGSTDVSVKMKGTAVKTNFYMDNDSAFDLILEHTEELAQILEKKGYQCQIEVKNEERNMDFVEDFLKRDTPNTGKVFRYSFDVRA